jgi:cell division protein FtsW
VLLLLGGFAGLLFLIRIAPYRLDRLAVFFDPSLDPLGKGYQIKQALIGIGSGGITGVGLGLSFQKFGSLPEPIGDSIFAIFAEEIGFIGVAFLIVLFLAFAWRSFMIAKRAEDAFAKNAAIGIACWITLQAFVNMGSMVGLLPLTGVPLPFISYGGSALVAELIGIGILLNISKG